MRIEVTKVIDIIKDYNIKIDENIQRNFQWINDKTKEYFDKVEICSALIASDKEFSSTLGCMGTFTCFKQTPNTNINYFLDDGGHRLICSILTIERAKNIIETYGLENDETYEFLYKDMKQFVKNIKQNFSPHPKDTKDFNMILNGQINTLNIKKNNCSSLLKCYFLIEKRLNNVFNRNEQEFINICNFLTNDLKFMMKNHEYTSIEIRRITYNMINNMSQQQTPFSVGMSKLSEDAESLGVENFSQQLTEYKEEFKNQYKKKNEKNEYFLFEDYCFIRLYSEFGLLTKNHSVLKIDKIWDYFKKVVPNEQRKSFYDSLFDKSKIDLFLNLYGRVIKFGLPPSKQSYLCEFLFQSNIFYFDDKGPMRIYVASIFYNLLSNVFEIIGGNRVVGVKSEFDQTLAFNLLRNLYFYRFLFTTDDKTGLGELLSDSRKIVNNEILKKYSILSDGLTNMVFSNEIYQNNNFLNEKDNYSKRDTRLLLHIVLNKSDDINESLHTIATQLNLKNSYHIDHIVPKWTKKSSNDFIKEEKDLIDNIGNLRILSGVKNVEENNLGVTRYITCNAPSFPQKMTERHFSVNDIVERRKWICDVVKTYNNYIYNFQFK